MKITTILLILFGLQGLTGCKNNAALLTPPPAGTYQTKNVIVVVIDGPRYSETWGAAGQPHVPYLARELAKQGVVSTAFFNDGFTYTNAGHAAITTGVRQGINNGGRELPRKPSFFQYWLEATGSAAEKAWLVTSKDKLSILADTKDKNYQGKFMPAFDCGINGPFTGYREDSVTLRVARQVLARHRPHLLLINFKEPDARAHQGDWDDYLAGISSTDRYVYELWNFLQNDAHYRGTTTLLVTNDHGRHLDGHADGFVSHGDNCRGCRHLTFFAAGPDFKTGKIVTTPYNQTDIPATIAALLGFKMPTGEGQVMRDLFKAP